MDLKKGFIIGIVGVVIAIIGMFLPWAQVSYTENGAQQTVSVYGYIAIFMWILIIIGLIGILLRKPAGGIVGAIFGILAFLYGIWNYMMILGLSQEYKNAGYTDVKVDVGIGMYITIVGTILLLIGGIILFIETRKERKTAKIETPKTAEEQ